MRFLKKLFIVIFVLVLASCGKDTVSTVVTQDGRPHDPFIFRSVLDRIPRMVTFALHDDLWVAYKINDCALYKAWKGGVNFDGPVYTTHHGPQPTTIGNAYMENKVANPWSIIDPSGKTHPAKANYKGHRIVGSQGELMYEISYESLDTPIKIYERPEAKIADNGQVVFERVFTTASVPEGYKVQYGFNASGLVVEQNISTDGLLELTDKEEVAYDKASLLALNGRLELNSTASTFLNIAFHQKPMIANPFSMDMIGEEEGSGHPGERLIAKNDCKTCHNVDKKTIGPAYLTVARKYKTTDENIELLTGKVINGGTGVWGEQIMNAHPSVPVSDVKEMVRYILSLDDDSEEAVTTDLVGTNTSITPINTVKEEDLIPGAVTLVYDYPNLKNTIPAITATMKPKFAGIMPSFGNINGDDFKELSDDFVLVANGYLLIEKSQEYSFRIWSDDGSIMILGEKEILNNDGMHGVEYKETSLNLEKGIYPFKLSFMQGAGGKFLSMNWKPADGEKWDVIPRSVIFHTKEMQSVIGPRSLPMANISKIPGDRNALDAVHPSFDLKQARSDAFTPKVGGIDFLSDGRMIVSTWDAAGSVFVVENHASGNPDAIKHKLIAQGLAEPLGVKVVDDRIFVMQKQEITELVDTNGDDIIDEYRTLCDDWEVSANFHEFGFGLEAKDGHLYCALATAIEPGGASTNPQIKDRGKVMKVNINTGERTFIAHGLRTPNGVGLGYGGDIYVADNQGDWLPSSKIVHVTDDAWFGSRSVDYEGTAKLKEKLPVVWLPQDEIGNSPSTPLSINVGPYKNQMIHGEVTHGGVKRVFVEEVNGAYQGGVFRFIQGLEAGVNRMRWSPDGALYVGGIGSTGNWGHSGKLWYGLQRLEYNGKPSFEMLAVRAKSNGVEIEFTQPLQANEGWDPSSYEVRQWYYKPTIDYGGPKLDNKALKIKSATVSEDRQKVFLELDGMKSGHVVYIRLVDKFISDTGLSLWSTECWYTMNNIPQNNLGIAKQPPYDLGNNKLTPQEIKEGWELLFDGKVIDKFRNFKKQSIGKSWIVQDEAIHLNSVAKDGGGWQAADGGDIITDKPYENFDFKAEWKIGNCGNSGIIFNVVEDDKYDYVWQTGPEMQILDNSCHPDTRYDTHRAGDLYDMIETKYITVNSAGQWNKVRIISNKGKVDFYLNGYKVVEFEMHNDKWKEMIANSKFKDMPDFGLARAGHISLQDHGDKVWFRNLKIKRLD